MRDATTKERDDLAEKEGITPAAAQQKLDHYKLERSVLTTKVDIFKDGTKPESKPK